MAVQVRLFAALREAAGTAWTEADPGTVAEILAELSERFGELFASRVKVCSCLVDGSQAGAQTPVPDGAELVLLPPVSGGAQPEPVPGSVLAPALAAGGFPLLLAAAVLVGRGPYVAAVLILAVWVLADVSEILALASARPVLVAAAIPGVLLPLAVAWRPDPGWEQVPVWMAMGFLVCAGLVLVFGRRRAVVAGLGSTLAAALLVGLGSTALVLLLHLPDGFRWVVALLATIAVADVAGVVAEGRLGVQPVFGTVVGAGAAGVAATALLRPPLDPAAGALLVLAVLVAATGSRETQRALLAEARLEQDGGSLRPGSGGVLGAMDGLLLAAPVVYLVARATGL